MSSEEHLNPLSDDKLKQRLRLRRFLISLAFYAACNLCMYFLAWLGHLPPALPLIWTAVFGATTIGFFALLKSGVNQRFADPSMTVAQLVVAIFAIAVLLYHAGEMRATLVILYPACLMFGALRLRMGEVIAVGAYAVATYAAVIGLLQWQQPGQITLEVELIRWAIVAATLALMCPFVGYLSSIRRRLSKSLRTIEELARRDALTGVYNRHHLMATLERDIARCERGEGPFLLTLADIDHFKRINDNYGHLAGDYVLRAVAERIRDTLRQSDYLARYGGEEFILILLPGVGDLPMAGCDRIRSEVENLALPALNGYRVTISMGVTAWVQGDTAATLLARADSALYRAKTGGRNRVEWEFATAAAAA